MGRARILGNNAKIFVLVDKTPVQVGEVDKFSAKNASELKKSQALGQKTATSQLVYGGWELSFEGGKVDGNLARMLHEQDKQIAAGLRSPYFVVQQKIKYFSGFEETYTYNDVTLHGYNLDMGGATEELGEKFEGFAASRALTSTDIPDVVADSVGTLISDSLAAIINSTTENDDYAIYEAGKEPGAFE